MRDMHCHILPGVDDGARDMAMSLAHGGGRPSRRRDEHRVHAPLSRSPYFDYGAMWSAFALVTGRAPKRRECRLRMGFEVAHAKLVRAGGAESGALAWRFRRRGSFSLSWTPRLPRRATSGEYERTILRAAGAWGYDGDHRASGALPGRAAQRRARGAPRADGLQASGVRRLHCRRQAGQREKRPAKKLFERNLYRYIASDAHRPEHYRLLARAVREYPRRGAHMRT